MRIEIDFEKFEDEYKLTLTENNSKHNLVFEDEDNNKLILLKIKNKKNNCISCVPVKRKDISIKSIRLLEDTYKLKLSLKG